MKKGTLGFMAIMMMMWCGRAAEIACPVALWEDMSALFELGEPLNLLEKAHVFGGAARKKEGVVLVSTYGGGDIGSGLSLSANEDFAGLKAERSVEMDFSLTDRPLIEALTDGVGLWVQTEPYVYLSFRFSDKTGRTFSIPAHRQKTDGWEYAAAPLKSVVLWDGSDHRAVELPVRFKGIQLSTVEGDFSFDFSAKLRGLQRVSRPDEDQPQLVTVDVDNPPTGLVYRPGQTAKVSLSVPDGNAEIRWRFVEYGGNVLAEGAGRGNAVLERRLDLPGHYQFLIELIEGGKRTDYRTLSLAVIEANPPSHDRIGLCGHWNRWYYGLDTLDLLPLVGVNRVRDHVAWHQVEKKKGEMTMPNMMSRFLEEARQRGIRGMTILNGKAIHYGGGLQLTPEAIDAFIEYCRFVQKEYTGVYDQFELWNEWSHGTGMEGSGFEPTPENYALLARQVVPELRRTFPKDAEFVGFGGENPYVYGDEILGMFRAGGGEYFDSFSLHPYRQPFPPEITHRPGCEPLDETMKKYLAISRENGGPNKIQITEMGYPVFKMGWGVNEVEHARYMVRTLAILHSIPEVDDVYWYALRDELEIPLRGNAPTSISFAQHGYGLFRDKRYSYAPKPAAVAMATYVQQTAGGTFGPMQRLGDGVFRVDVSEPDGSRRCALLWTLKDEAVLSVTGRNLKVMDLMGRSKPVRNGRVDVSQDPVYLLGDPEFDSAAVK